MTDLVAADERRLLGSIESNVIELKLSAFRVTFVLLRSEGIWSFICHSCEHKETTYGDGVINLDKIKLPPFTAINPAGFRMEIDILRISSLLNFFDAGRRYV